MISTASIYLPCNFEVNLISRIGVIAPFSTGELKIAVYVDLDRLNIFAV
jgi:hypothetical protein